MKKIELLTKEFLSEQFLNKNKSIVQISKEFNLCRHTVGRYIKKYNIKKHKIPFSFDSVNQMYQNGVRPSKIARKFNTSILSITSLLQENGTSLKSKIPNKNKKGSNHPSWKGHLGISGQWWANLKASANSRILPFDISIEYVWDLLIRQDFKCALSKLPINLEIGYIANNKSLTTASLDRIDSNKGYVVDNIQWVHKRVNMMKGTLQDKEFIEFCKAVAQANI